MVEAGVEVCSEVVLLEGYQRNPGISETQAGDASKPYQYLAASIAAFRRRIFMQTGASGK